MIIDRAKFYSVMRRELGALTQGRVEGTNAILDAWEQRYCKQTSVPQFATCLATAYWETAHTMKPIHEYGDRARFMRLYDVSGSDPDRARRYGNTEVGDGAKYCGRGLVQLTWKVNYAKATKRLRELKIIDAGVDFVKNPDLVMQDRYAIPIMFIGMEEGWFTGKKLDDIVDDDISADLKDEKQDLLRSRAIINGKDKAEQIAEIGLTFLRALVASVDKTAKVKVEPPVPEPPPEAAHAGASTFNRFWKAVAELVGTKKG